MLLVALAALVTLAVPGAAADERDQSSAWSSIFAMLRPLQPVDPHHVVVVFDDPSLAAWRSSSGAALSPQQQAAFLRRAQTRQDERLQALRAAGVQFEVRHRYLRVLNGASLVLQGDDLQWLRDAEGVDLVAQVATVYPAANGVRAATSDETAAAAGAEVAASAKVSPSAGTTSAATVAVLDTGIDFNHPLLRPAQAGPGYDAVARRVGVDADQGDGHGTQVAGGVLAAANGAPVKLESVRVLQSQPALGGAEAVLGRSDDLLAGFERAVDLNGDGDTADHAAVALAAVSIPYASFAGSVEERAVAGAEALGVVTVAAAGNDGASGDQVGTIGAPAAARAAIAVGAADLRTTAPVADVHVRGGVLDVVLDGAPLLTRSSLDMPKGELPVVAVAGSAADVVDYLGADVRSRVAGAIALVQRDSKTLLADQVRAAADAGAVAVLIADAAEPSAAGVLDAPGADVPAVGLTGRDAQTLLAALERDVVRARLSARGDAANAAYGTVADFSSRGPRFDGVAKPDLLAPGVGVITSDAGRARDGTPRYGIVSGTSIAAAQVAGQVAALRHQRPRWTPTFLRAALVASARPLGAVGSRTAIEAQGAGVVDSAAALAARTIAVPARVDFGVVAPGEAVQRALQLRDATDGAPLALPALHAEAIDRAGPQPALAGDGLAISVPPGTRSGIYGGWLLALDRGVRVPWTVVVRPRQQLVVPVRASLTDSSFPAAQGPGELPARLEVTIGGTGSQAALALSAASLLHVHLLDERGAELGIVGTLTNALAGRYTFGVSGRGPAGAALEPGRYALRVDAVSAATPGAAAQPGPVLGFTVERR